MQGSNDKISCGCGNRFNIIDVKHYWRPISCIKCRRMWWFTCSGRRLRANDMDFETFKDFMKTAWAAEAKI